MEYSLRKTSFNKSSHGSSSFKNRGRNSSSYDSNNWNYSDDEESSWKKDGNNRHGEVIVKIESPIEDVCHEKGKSFDDNNNVVGSSSSNTLWRGSSEEFSFPWPATGENLEEEDLRGMEEEIQKQQHDEEEQGGGSRRMTPRHQGGLPPLPRGPPDTSWSRNQSEVLSPDLTTTYQYKIPGTSTNPNPNPGNNNGQSRVSFHESLTSERLIRRPSSMYSNVLDDSSSCSSSMSGDDQDNYDKENDHSAEIAKSPSNMNNNNAANSFRRMASKSFSKTKSRLIDPPSSTPIDQRSGPVHKSGQLNKRSGLLGKSSMFDDDEDDPFLEDDFPEEFKASNVSIFTILEWVSLIFIMGALVCSLVIPILRKKTLWNMKLWKWEVLILVLICGRLVSDWGIRIIVFFIERSFLLRKRVLYFVYGLKKAVQKVIWLGLVLLTWFFLFDTKVLMEATSKPLRVVTKLLIIGEVGAILWLLKTLLIKVLASNFQVKAFFERIQDSLFNQFVIETLSAPPMFEIHQAREEEERTMAELQSLQNAGAKVPPDLRATVFGLGRNKSGKGSILQSTPQKNNNNNTTPYKSPTIRQSTRFSDSPSKKHAQAHGYAPAHPDEGITIHTLHKLNQQNVSAWNMKRLVRIIRKGSLTTLDEQIVDGTIEGNESSIQIRSEVEAKAAASKIFRNVAKPRSRYIYLDDIMRFMPEDEAFKTMNLFEGANESDRINKKSLKNWVVNAFRERRALALTLSDTKTAVNKLHKIMNVIVSIIILIILIIHLDIVTSQSLLFLSSQIVVVAFVFGNTCKNVFESIIFLFVIHPFDMIVDEINILTTVFLRYDNQKIVYPNYVLLTKPIHNYYRSPDMGDAIELCFHIATPAEKIAVMRQRITSYIENKKEHWYPSPMIVLKDMDGPHMLRVAIWLQHRMNHQDMGERW
ncbi:Mechanosensitive ion channel protein 8, partial [Bienertia sinuspersici]